MAHQNSKLPVAVVGWSGYSGLELVKLILAHPHMELSACFSRNLKQNLSDYFSSPQVSNVPVLDAAMLESEAEKFDTIFFATPIDVSKELIPKLRGKKLKLIDLSGAFRLEDNSDFDYGLQPWAGPLKNKWVSNPGCYATSVLMALLPLLKEKLIEPSTIVIDAKSGATGAGKSARSELLFCEVEGNCLPYKVGGHQHLPEISFYLKQFSDVTTDIFFTTHLLPLPRGIISSIYAKTNPAKINPAKTNPAKTTVTEAEVLQAFAKAYENDPLVVVQRLTEDPKLLKLSQVVGSARTHISFKVVDDKIFLFSCIDNLMKGAASQAIENWNVLHDRRPSTSLEELL